MPQHIERDLEEGRRGRAAREAIDIEGAGKAGTAGNSGPRQQHRRNTGKGVPVKVRAPSTRDGRRRERSARTEKSERFARTVRDERAVERRGNSLHAKEQRPRARRCADPQGTGTTAETERARMTHRARAAGASPRETQRVGRRDTATARPGRAPRERGQHASQARERPNVAGAVQRPHRGKEGAGSSAVQGEGAHGAHDRW